MNDYFHYQGGTLYAEQASLAEIAVRFGTPCYVYSRAALTDNLRQFNDAGGELQRVLAAGGDTRKVVFSGVGKTAEEMRMALEADILCFNVESSAELERLNEVAAGLGKVAAISLRVNPDVDAKTHPYISTGLKQNKFGVAYSDAIALYRKARGLSNLRITGMDCHIGSQLIETGPFIDAAKRILELADALSGEDIHLEHLDLGGGLGIRYNDENPPAIGDYVSALLDVLRGRDEKLILEPGRVLVGNAGILLTRVEYLKHGEMKNFAVVDAAMNDLMRPALYDAYHGILPIIREQHAAQSYDVVGPICETGDFIGHARELAIAPQSLLAVLSAGAYGMSMSSNYNTRPRAAEVVVDGDIVYQVRERETLSQLYAGEKLIP
jgi:diaminopimelate decarboxylase